MKKRIVILMMAMLLGACGCGVKEEVADAIETAKEAKPIIKSDYESLDEIIEAINTDIAATTSAINEDYSKVVEKITSYEEYEDGTKTIDDYFENIYKESDTLFEKIYQNSVAYFKMALDTCGDNDSLEKAFDKYYDKIYDDAYEDYYDDVYDDMFDKYYDDIYDEIFDDAYDKYPHKEVMDARSECYKQYLEARSNIYKRYLGSRSKCYAMYSAFNSNAIYGKERDFDAIMKIVDEKIKEQEEEAKRRSEEVDYETVYEIRNGKAYVTGITGEGNHIYISSEYDDCEVVGIDDSAFEGTNVQGMSCWADIEEIGANAFKDCTELVEMSIPSSVTVIGNSAFENCTNLSEISIWGDPDIGDSAFKNCTSIKEVSIGGNTKRICDNAFSGCSNLETLYVWAMDVKIGKDAFAGCDKLDNKPKEDGESVQLDSDANSTGDDELKEDESQETVDIEVSEGIRPEFQTAMDEYVEFFEEYCAFIKKYTESGNSLEMLADYTKYMSQYAETMQALDEAGNQELTKEEEKLLLDTQNTINKMLIDAM